MLEEFIEALVPLMPRNNKALLNWQAMYVPPGEPAAQPEGSAILTKVNAACRWRFMRVAGVWNPE